MDTIEILKDLIKIKSYSGSEDEVREYIAKFSEENSLDYEIQDKNILIKFINNFETCLILNGHMDTVASGDEAEWSSSPFEPVISENKIFGLGSSDMKSGIAAFLSLASEIKKEELKIDLIFAFVVNEEVDGSGSESFAKYFMQHYKDKYKESFAIFGEPTDLEHCEIGHRGNFFIKLITSGDSGHGSRPEEVKEHSILKMMDVVDTMQRIEIEVQSEFKNELLGVPTFGLTSINSDSDSPNKFSGKCASIWDIRTTPELHNSLIQMLKQKLPADLHIEIVGSSPFAYTKPKSKIIQALKNIVPELVIDISKGASDMCFFSEVGIPAICFGPGVKSTIHKPNEYALIDKIEESVKIYRELINQLSK